MNKYIFPLSLSQFFVVKMKKGSPGLINTNQSTFKKTKLLTLETVQM